MQKGRALVLRNTIFRRLLLIFLLNLLPIYLVGIYIHNGGVKAIQEQITSTVNSQDAFYMEKLELEISRILSLSRDCLTDENLRSLVYIGGTLTNYEKSRATLRLQYRLNSIKNSSGYIKDIKVCIPTLEYTISADRGANFYDRGDISLLEATDLSNEAQLTYYGGKLYLIQQCWSTSRNTVLYWIEISLDQTVLNGDLEQFNDYPNGMSALHFASSGLTFIKGLLAGEDADSVRELIMRQTGEPSGSLIKISGNEYSAYYHQSDYLGLVLVRYIPTDVALKPLRSYQIWLWVFLALSIFIVVIFSISTNRFIFKPLDQLLVAFKKVESGDLAVTISTKRSDEFGDLYNGFNSMTANLGLLINQVYYQKILAQKAELKQLQSQINPHFLYNSFFTLNSIIRAEDYDTAFTFIKQLGEYFKYITRLGDDEVKLSNEVDHAKIYANIQLLRFGNKLSVCFDEVPAKYLNLPVPKLIVQPILENAFKYALEGNIKEGYLRVSFSEADSFLIITIEDNGKNVGEETISHMREALHNNEMDGEITGMINIHRRLKLRFSDKSGLRIGMSELGGVKVEICIEIPEDYHV